MSYPPERPLFVRWHLGVGDSLICNGLVRHFAKQQAVIIPCKHQNLASVQFQFRDNPNIDVLPVADDAEADRQSMRAQDVLRLGMFGDNFSFKEWDRVMYEQAGIPFDVRWSGFYYERERSTEFYPPLMGEVTTSKGAYYFLHEDAKRNFVIRDNLLPSMMGVEAERTPGTIFDYRMIIENATEIHCIDSVFAILADSIPTTAKRHVLHLYARPDAKPPTLRKPWQILT